MTPNRKGRPLNAAGVRARAANRAQLAVDALADVAADANAPAVDRVQAAATLLEHAIKVPAKNVAITQ
jgi:formiminotetrahydrofolate cyclodeaminase